MTMQMQKISYSKFSKQLIEEDLRKIAEKYGFNLIVNKTEVDTAEIYDEACLKEVARDYFLTNSHGTVRLDNKGYTGLVYPGFDCGNLWSLIDDIAPNEVDVIESSPVEVEC